MSCADLREIRETLARRDFDTGAVGSMPRRLCGDQPARSAAGPAAKPRDYSGLKQ